MKSVLSKMTMTIMTFLFAMTMFSICAFADNAVVTVTPANGTKGEVVAVPVTLNADTNASGQVALAYDTKYMDFLSVTYTDGAGNPQVEQSSGVAGIAIWNVNGYAAGTPRTVNFNFTLKEAGATKVTVSDNTQLKTSDETNPENAELNVVKTSANISVIDNTAISNDSKLSGLIISSVSQNGETKNLSYSPSFSPDVFEYAADVGSNINRIIVATTLSDSHSTASVSGSRIDLGNNKTTITVTAQDGSQSVYTIYTQRLPEGSEQQSQASPQGQVVTDSASQNQPQDFDRSPVLVESMNKYIIQDFSLVSIPDGFEESTITYNGRTVADLKGQTKNLTLLCIADDPQGTNAAFYIYNETSGQINKMVNFVSKQKTYTIIPTDDTYAGPEGYTQTTLDINGDVVKAWIKSADSQFYVIYAMNWNGEANLYFYDSVEGTIQRFIDGAKSENISDNPQEDSKEYLKLRKNYNNLNDSHNELKTEKNMIIIVFLAGNIVLMIVFVLVIKKLSGAKKEIVYSSNKINEDKDGEELIIEEKVTENVIKDEIKDEIKEAEKEEKKDLKDGDIEFVDLEEDK